MAKSEKPSPNSQPRAQVCLGWSDYTRENAERNETVENAMMAEGREETSNPEPFAQVARRAVAQDKMADTDLDSSNPLFEILADWNEQLKHIDFDSLDDPQAQPPVVELEEPQP